MRTSLIIIGSNSNVGKTFICTCLCKIARSLGLTVVPFKAQNMTNVMSCTDETISQLNMAQWTQSLASNSIPKLEYNPILIKPLSNGLNQLYMKGILARHKFSYPGSRKLNSRIRSKIINEISSLKQHHDLVVIEGAGSGAEINLWSFDVNNIWLAVSTFSNIIFIADMERGGALASIVGTHFLFPFHINQKVTGFLLNKFIGHSYLLSPAINALARLTAWPCLGIVPWITKAFELPWEDTLCGQNLSPISSTSIIIDIVCGEGIGELLVFASEPSLTTLVLKMPPTWIPSNLKLIILPDTTLSSNVINNFQKTSWSIFLIRAKVHGALIIGIGSSLLLLTIAKDHELQHSHLIFTLNLLNLNLPCLQCSTYSLQCTCKLLSINFIVNISTHFFFLLPILIRGYRPLLQNNKSVYGIYSSNVWGIAVGGVFVNDDFRSALIRFIDLQPSPYSYITNLKTTITNLSLRVANTINPILLKLFNQ